MIVSSALMIWKGLMVVTGSESPIVVVLRLSQSWFLAELGKLITILIAVDPWSLHSIEGIYYF